MMSYDEKIEKLKQLVASAKEKKEIKRIVNFMYYDKTIQDDEFTEFIYTIIAPRLYELGVKLDNTFYNNFELITMGRY